jgi:hypothetical protein
MMKLFGGVIEWQRPKYTLWVIFILLINNACQPQPFQAPLSPTPSPILSTITLTPTETIIVPSPTVTPSPTMTVQPTATEVPIPLSRNGPWLAYKPYYTIENEHFMVNQDGTGRVRIVPDCNPGDIQASPFNDLVVFPGMLYLFAPLHWTLVYSDWPSCGSDYTGNNKKGLLADMFREYENPIPELLIYELPSGKVRDRFPVLFKCPDEDESCNIDNIEWWNFELAWSPNGRYLAFVAALENQASDFGPSSDLYMYDAQSGDVLRLTSGPDSVAQIWWSPDGKWIIMGELHEKNYPFTTSLWAVSATDNEMRKLYSLEDGYPQGILGWLDDRRFIVYDGTSLKDALDLPAYNLDVVDIDTGTVTPLYRGSFWSANLAADSETIALGVYRTEQEGNKGDGTYLVSVSDSTLRFVGQDLYQPDWDDKLQLFVTDRTCENSPDGRLAFDTKGKWQCIHPALPDRYPSPNGRWQVSIQDGTWLRANDQQPVQIMQGNAVQVIWRPDSEGFFFVADQTLYYVSLPQATPVVIDAHVRGNSISYQWLDWN